MNCFSEIDKKDGFDTLIESTPDKLEYVTSNLKKFVNEQLVSMKIVVKDVIEDFRNGVIFLILIGQLQGIFQSRAILRRIIADCNFRILCPFVRVFHKTGDRRGKDSQCKIGLRILGRDGNSNKKSTFRNR